MKTERKAIRIILFFLILILIILALQIPFRNKDSIAPEMVYGFYAEEKNSLDAVYIGSNTTYAFWQGTTAWENTGIAVYPFAVPSLPAQSLKYMIIEARKTQENPLFILNLNTFGTTEIQPEYIHKTTNYLSLSANKLKMIDMLLDASGVKGLDRLEYYLPIIRYHDEWQNTKANDVVREYYNYKGAEHNKTHFSTMKDISKWDRVIGTSEPVSEIQKTILEDLFQYIREENLKVLFVLVPNEASKPEKLEQLNSVAHYVSDAGFSVLNLVNQKSELNLDTTTDYYNEQNTNIHGALKFSAYLTDYLSENYTFTDKRGSDDYKSWDEAAKKWKKQAAPYVLDIELNYEKRDSELEAPTLSLKRTTKNNAALSWNNVDDADAYHVYRKDSKKNVWEHLTELPADAQSYTDKGLKSGVTYTYTIIASRDEAGMDVYGNCDYAGKAVTLP